MKLLITGVTETHINHPNRASSTKFVSIPEMMAYAYTRLGHQVDHRAIVVGEDLSVYDTVFVYLYPLDGNAIDHVGAVYALEQRPDAYICLDDWSFRLIMPSWCHKIDAEKLQNRTWLAPLFPWGDTTKMGLDVQSIKMWDPSPLCRMPPVHKLSWHQRKTEWYNASLSKDAHVWTTEQNLSWPVHSVGGKALGQPRILEDDVVWQYGQYKGVLCPTYAHAGSGWWRVRYLHAAHAGCVLGGSSEELGVIGASYAFSMQDIENMGDASLQMLAQSQAHSLRFEIDIDTTVMKLESYVCS
jgi:hypothetical protein